MDSGPYVFAMALGKRWDPTFLRMGVAARLAPTNDRSSALAGQT